MKKLWILSLIILWAFDPSALTSQQEPMIALHGGAAEAFLDSCSAVERVDFQTNQAVPKDAMAVSYCYGYILGIWDTREVMNAIVPDYLKSPFCIPNNATPSQLAKVVLKYGKDHPEELNQAANLVVNNALRQAFPCGSN